MELDNLIFDRTQADVDRAKYLAGLWKNGAFTGTTAELAEWATDLKGAYNATDLNRVIAAMDYLNEYFLGLGYDVGYTKIVAPHQSMSPLPDGYVQLEYIQSSGAQCIDTGFKPNQDTRLLIEGRLLDNTGTISIAGQRYNSSVKSFAWISVSGRLRSYYNVGYGPVTYDIDTNDHVFDKNKNISIIDDVQFTSSAYKEFSGDFTIYLFACHEETGIAFPSKFRLYSCEIYDDWTIVRDFIPCLDPNENIGLYDLIEHKFYSNIGNATFTAGPGIYTPSQDQYTWYETDIPSETQMEIYRQNIEKFRNKIPYPEVTPDTPSDMKLLTYQEANDIEKILYTLESVLIAMEEAFLLRQANTLFMIAGGVFNNA